MQVDYLPSLGLAGHGLYHTLYESRFGPTLLVADGHDRLAFLGFCAAPQAGEELRQLADKWQVDMSEKRTLHALGQAVFAGAPPPLALCGTPFQHRVWRALLRLGPGHLSSYGALATALGSHARAIGGAVGANPVSYVVPCHRIVAANGKLNGYRWGLGVKQALLAAEQG